MFSSASVCVIVSRIILKTNQQIFTKFDGKVAQGPWKKPPRAGSGVVRIDPLRFLAGCRIKRLNQALSVLSLSLGFL